MLARRLWQHQQQPTSLPRRQRRCALAAQAFPFFASTPSSSSTDKHKMQRGQPPPAGDADADASAAAAVVRRHAVQAPGRAHLAAALVERIPPTARIIALGEASHGTQDFYAIVSGV
jgi:hypothetical protein